MSGIRAVLRGLLAALLVGLLAGCEETETPLRIGSKDFAENTILGEMMAALVEREGVPVQRSIPYGNAFVTFEALRQGRLDLYPEYNGTGLLFLGQPPTADGDAAMERLRPLYGELGLVWRGRLGFSNDYVLAMRPERAQALGVTRISDLGRLPEVRFAVDEDFTKRPVDGLGALVRRYGLRQGPLVTQKLAETGAKDRIVQALLEDDAEVAELFRTDAQIEEYGLVVLDDDLRFFPVYQPAPLVRDETLRRFPAVTAALARLEGKVTSEAMRKMNADVERGGQSAANMALGFLIDQGLLERAGNAQTLPGEALVFAIDAADSRSGPAGRALRATRTAFPKRAVEVREVPQPLSEVAAGRARLGVVSAEAFFTAENGRVVRSEAVEAMGVVGYKLAHLVARQGGPANLDDVRRLGVGEADGASDRAARLVLDGLGRGGVQRVTGPSDLAARFAALDRGEVDALFVMAPEGDPTLLELMNAGTGHRLLALDAWTAGNAPLRLPFLRPAQIPAGGYAGQNGPVETVSAQMVLIGPPSEREAIGAQGPVTTGSAPTQPLPVATVKELNRALGTSELVDPALPTPPALRPELAPPPPTLKADVPAAATNLLVLVALGYLFYLLVAEPRRAARGDPRA